MQLMVREGIIDPDSIHSGGKFHATDEETNDYFNFMGKKEAIYMQWNFAFIPYANYAMVRKEIISLYSVEF